MLFKTVAVVYLYLFCVRGVICCQKFPKWILGCRSYFFKSHFAFPSLPCPLMLDNHASRDCYCGDKRLLLPTPHDKALVTWAFPTCPHEEHGQREFGRPRDLRHSFFLVHQEGRPQDEHQVVVVQMEHENPSSFVSPQTTSRVKYLNISAKSIRKNVS